MTPPKKLVIGSRGSQLATTQATWVCEQIRERFPSIDLSIQKVKTSGDVRTDQPLGDAGRKGLYTREIECVLQEGRIDLAVHSMKDVPAELAEDFQIAAVTKRIDPRDVFISRRHESLSRLPKNAKVGTASLRRLTQLKNLRPDLIVVPIRGNVDTRLKKLESQNLDAIILAAAGLIRLGRENEVTEYLEPDVMIPSAGQGALAIEVRAGDELIQPCVAPLNDSLSAVEATAERTLLRRLSGGCQVPISAYAKASGEHLHMRGFVANPEGDELLRAELEGSCFDAEALGHELAEALLSQGAQRLIDQILSHVEG